MMDLGQFERFRRIMHTPYFATLLEHRQAQVLSTLQLSERKVRLRLEVVGYKHDDLRVYEMTMVQVGLGGCTYCWCCRDTGARNYTTYSMEEKDRDSLTALQIDIERSSMDRPSDTVTR